MRSRNNPRDIMAEVYRALEALNFVSPCHGREPASAVLDAGDWLLQQWKVITPFHVRCRCWNQVSGVMVRVRPTRTGRAEPVMMIRGGSLNPVQMKMTLQLFQNDRQFLLDFKNLPTSEADRLQSLDEHEPHPDAAGRGHQPR
jgi:5'-AMP-activated protein kinase catalytic alpha subunit